MKPTIVAITGASGVIYGVRLVQTLLESGHAVELVISEAGRLVIREELGAAGAVIASGAKPACRTGGQSLNILDCFVAKDAPRNDKLRVYSPKDFTAPIASGSYPAGPMVVVPCSMGTLGAIASGISQNLIHRAADCTMKEGRKLVLVPRETPLNAIHLENMLKLSRLGVSIVPAMPGFYSGAESLQEVIDFMVGKILDQLGVAHALYPRWTGLTSVISSEARNPGATGSLVAKSAPRDDAGKK
jgi:4-hydroxy-3-polyprenylbenzoate decarboxylase